MQMNDFAGNDQSNHRVYDLDSGNHLHLKRTDPYGFIYLSLDKGQLPVGYAGVAFTDWTQARIAAEKYISARQDIVSEARDAPLKEAIKERPTLHLKR